MKKKAGYVAAVCVFAISAVLNLYVLGYQSWKQSVQREAIAQTLTTIINQAQANGEIAISAGQNKVTLIVKPKPKPEPVDK